MAATLEDLLRAVHSGPPTSSRSPRGVFQRLQVIASLLRAESPATEGSRLLWRDERGEVTVQLLTRELVLGREPGCDLVFASPRVSRRHCIIRGSDDGFEVEDLGSSNGTSVNGARIQRHILHDGDTIEFGGVVVVYAA